MESSLRGGRCCTCQPKDVVEIHISDVQAAESRERCERRRQRVRHLDQVLVCVLILIRIRIRLLAADAQARQGSEPRDGVRQLLRDAAL